MANRRVSLTFYRLMFIGKFLRGSYRPYVSIAMIGLLGFIASAAIGVLTGIAQPQVHDEFSYLLAADTFAHGRITNPPHPMWIHFETFHVIHQPTYMSKYQPAQGMMLAFGRVIGGHPIVGAWLNMAFMCAAICWMLHAWLPPRWAVLGGLLAIIHPNIGVSSYWAQSYWGGALPAAGGALLLGGIRYVVCKPRVLYALATGIGLAILANSRPYEGLILSLPLGVALLVKFLSKNKPPTEVTLRRTVLPLVFVGAITVSCMGYYNYRIAGSPLQLPYLVHEKAYTMFAYFVWQDLPPQPDYRHEVIRDYHAKYELPLYLERRTFAGFIHSNYAMLMMYLLLAGSVFLVPLVGSARALIVWCWNNYWGRVALATYIVFACGVMLESVVSLHYWAPITALSYFFILQGIRLWRARNPRVGEWVLYGVPLLAAALLVISIYQSYATYDEQAPHLQRAKLLAQLERQGGQHLVIVKYGPNHSYDREWIYNEADIDSSKVVWAHDMKVAKNCELAKYFRSRRAWFLEIDNDSAPVRLKPFALESCLPEDSRS